MSSISLRAPLSFLSLSAPYTIYLIRTRGFTFSSGRGLYWGCGNCCSGISLLAGIDGGGWDLEVEVVMRLFGVGMCLGLGLKLFFFCKYLVRSRVKLNQAGGKLGIMLEGSEFFMQ